MEPDTVLISPDHRDGLNHAALLLGLAEDVNHVQTTMDGPNGLSFVVPQYLAELYEKALALQAGEDEGDTEEAPAKRKPGRPKKNTDSGS